MHATKKTVEKSSWEDFKAMKRGANGLTDHSKNMDMEIRNKEELLKAVRLKKRIQVTFDGVFIMFDA